MKNILMLSLVMMGLATQAIASGPKSEILRLTRAIENAILDSQASDSAIADAQQDLEHALGLISTEGSSGSASKECIDYAYAKYYASMGNSAATMDSEANACARN